MIFLKHTLDLLRCIVGAGKLQTTASNIYRHDSSQPNGGDVQRGRDDTAGRNLVFIA